MTIVRRVLPTRYYRLVFRTILRKHLLIPCPAVLNILGYWLGEVSRRYGILIHSVKVMSNHIHLDVSDPLGLRPDFERDFKGIGARALNTAHGRVEVAWVRSTPIEVRTAEDAAHGMAYTVCQAVEAGLVFSPNAWPGLKSTVEDIAECRTFTFKRPEFFRSQEQGGNLPDFVTWSLVPHPLGDDDPEALLAMVKGFVAKRLAAKRKQLKADGKRFRGVAAVMMVHWDSRPTTPEPRGRLTPTIACKDPVLRAIMITERLQFIAEYRAARKKWLEEGKAVFPAGTYQLRGKPGVTIREGP
jgi:putative transposase